MKNYTIIYSITGEKELLKIIANRSLYSKTSAKKYSDKLKQRIQQLSKDPELAPPINPKDPTRRKLLFNEEYNIGYKVDHKKELITILRIRPCLKKPIKTINPFDMD